MKIELFIFSDSSGRMICSTLYIRLTYKCDGNIRRFASLAMAKIRTKSETISLTTAELLSIKEGTNVAKIIQRLL